MFAEGGLLKRAVTKTGIANYRLLRTSALYDELVATELLVAHEEESPGVQEDVELVLVPRQIPYISYPYEWSFEQFRDAALLTLDLQGRALSRGMSLKDATPFNVQFLGSRPLFIDTLSFERDEGGPWVAYHQFCREFLGPLLLMAHRDAGINRLLSAEPGGWDLGFVSRMLPKRTYLDMGALLHIHLHARTKARPGAAAPAQTAGPNRKAALADSLRAAVEAIRLPRHASSWSDYYETRTHYPPEAEASRQTFVSRALARTGRDRLVLDLGANRGDYSRLASQFGLRCVAVEMDPVCANDHYMALKREDNRLVLPLRMDLCSPTPAIGFHCRERMSFTERPRAGLVLALALIHHLRISGQAPLSRIAEFLADLGDTLVLEFVPKSDPMVRAMLAHRADVFDDYHEHGLHDAMSPYWERCESQTVRGLGRTLHLYRRRH